MRRLFALFTLIVPIYAAPRASRVEVVTPKPPTPVLADGKRLLAYELHITNFGVTPLVLKRIEVGGVADFAGKELAAMLTPVGQSATADATTIDSGRRVIAFIWIAQSPNAPLPHVLRHRLTFEDSSIDDINVPVLIAHVPVLRPPFDDGEWFAGNGPSNSSVHRRSVVPLNGHVYIAQRFAIDWLLIGKNGDTFHDNRDRNENYWGFGQPVHAMAGGEVTEVVDEYEDHPPGQPPPVTLANIAGNHVIIRIAPNEYLVFAHLQQHSIRVRVHQKVKAGQVIAKLGNSGNTTGPHLHVHVADANSVLAAEGIPFVFDHFRFLGYGHDFDESKHPNLPRLHEMPVDDEVISPR